MSSFFPVDVSLSVVRVPCVLHGMQQEEGVSCVCDESWEREREMSAWETEVGDMYNVRALGREKLFKRARRVFFWNKMILASCRAVYLMTTLSDIWPDNNTALRKYLPSNWYQAGYSGMWHWPQIVVDVIALLCGLPPDGGKQEASQITSSSAMTLMCLTWKCTMLPPALSSLL